MQVVAKDLAGWMAFLSKAEIPVLRRTARELEALRQDADKLSARGTADIIARDPLLTVKLLRYLQLHKHRSQQREVVQVEQALMMLGLEVFFNHVPPKPLVEDLLHEQLGGLTQMLHVVHRAQRASWYAREWAVHLHDMHYEEVRIAALLHELAEVLMWCFAPDKMLEIRSLQQHDKTLRSRAVQEQVLGFALTDLQRALAREWELPALLLTLMDDSQSQHPRVRNVVLAVNLARHSANGWDDAALPDDYRDVGQLLHLPPEEVMVMVGAEPPASSAAPQ